MGALVKLGRFALVASPRAAEGQGNKARRNRVRTFCRSAGYFSFINLFITGAFGIAERFANRCASPRDLSRTVNRAATTGRLPLNQQTRDRVERLVHPPNELLYL